MIMTPPRPGDNPELLGCLVICASPESNHQSALDLSHHCSNQYPTSRILRQLLDGFSVLLPHFPNEPYMARFLCTRKAILADYEIEISVSSDARRSLEIFAAELTEAI